VDEFVVSTENRVEFMQLNYHLVTQILYCTIVYI